MDEQKEEYVAQMHRREKVELNGEMEFMQPHYEEEPWGKG